MYGYTFQNEKAMAIVGSRAVQLYYKHLRMAGAPETWNDAKVKSMKGVIGTVRLPDGVAVIADSLPHAIAARSVLQVKWNKTAGDSFDSEATLTKTYHQVHEDPSAKTQVLDQK